MYLERPKLTWDIANGRTLFLSHQEAGLAKELGPGTAGRPHYNYPSKCLLS
jgi:hypothetical protein